MHDGVLPLRDPSFTQLVFLMKGLTRKKCFFLNCNMPGKSFSFTKIVELPVVFAIILQRYTLYVMSNIDISVILVVHNRAESLPLCLTHLEHQTFPAARFEVIIVDDASDDATFEVLQRHAEGAPMRIQVLHQDSGGPGVARNVAIETAEGFWLLFLDQDMLAGPHLLERHVEAQERLGSQTAVVGTIHRHPHLSLYALSTRLMPGQPHTAPPEKTPLSFLDWNKANLSVPRRFFQEFGGFDTTARFACFDDAELAWRLIGHGIQAFSEHGATAYVWRESTLQARRINAYVQGYALYALEQHIRSGEIRIRFGLDKSAFRHALNTMLTPLMVQLCRTSQFNAPYTRRAIPVILGHDLYCGYKDAKLGRSPREYDLECVDQLPEPATLKPE